MTDPAPLPFIDPEAIDGARDIMRKTLVRLPPQARVALCNALLGVIVRALVNEAGRVSTGALLRAAAADAGAILVLSKRKRRSQLSRFIDGASWGCGAALVILLLLSLAVRI